MSHMGGAFPVMPEALATRAAETLIVSNPNEGGAMTDKSTSKDERLSKELLALYDEFSEFDACCAFFCEATASLSGNSDYCLEGASAEGLRILAQQLKERSATLKGQVEAVWKLGSSGDRH